MASWFPTIWAEDEVVLSGAIRKKGWDTERGAIRVFIRTPEEILEGMEKGIPDVVVRNPGSPHYNPSIQFRSLIPEIWRQHVRTLIYWDLALKD